ncbi:MAG: hypothetical protein LKG14_07900 [Prevotella sp.]|jgi:hypothetical protein|nr:hypothetical protein [Prevotella sp.]
MKRVLFLMMLIAVLFTPCAAQRNVVAYKVANNYFFRNDAKIPDSLKFVSQEQFDSCFGKAAFMGQKGMPTPIDFTKSFVIAKVLPATDVQTEIVPKSLTRAAGHVLNFRYQIKKGSQQSYTMQPLLILIVNKKYSGYKIKEN